MLRALKKDPFWLAGAGAAIGSSLSESSRWYRLKSRRTKSTRVKTASTAFFSNLAWRAVEAWWCPSPLLIGINTWGHNKRIFHYMVQLLFSRYHLEIRVSSRRCRPVAEDGRVPCSVQLVPNHCRNPGPPSKWGHSSLKISATTNFLDSIAW